MSLKQQTKKPVFVVVRQGRRWEQRNHPDRKSANKAAERIRWVLDKHNDPFAHKVWVKKTNKPWRVR
tara:strand:- start:1031 stop:1231 length:201 start_codon:yes stop_codon:yes gene_type:complete